MSLLVCAHLSGEEPVDAVLAQVERARELIEPPELRRQRALEVVALHAQVARQVRQPSDLRRNLIVKWGVGERWCGVT